MSTLFSLPAQVALDSSGDPMSGAVLRFYTTGTTTPIAVYADVDLNTSRGTSVTADAYGVFPAIWLSDSVYRVRLYNSAGTLLWTVDGVQRPDIGASDELPAANLTGTIADARLGTNVALYTATGKTYTGSNTYSGTTNFTGTLNYLTYEVGFRDLPTQSKTAVYTLALTDRGKLIDITTGGVIVPPNIFSAGQAVSIYNNSAATQALTPGTGVTLRQVGTANTGARVLGQRALVTVLCVASNEFVVSGGGLS